MKGLFLSVFIIATIIFISISGTFISDTKIIKVNKELNLKFLKQFNNEYILIFFGYVGCTNVCTPRLSELALVYDELKHNNIDAKVLFINMKKLEDENLANVFATSFHKDFSGIYMQKDELLKVQNTFSVYNTPSLLEKGEFNHTGFLFLVKKENNVYKWIRIFTQTPFNKDTILKDIEQG